MQAITSFAEVDEYLRKLYGNAQTKYSLDNIKALMAFLGNPQDKLKIIHVAGTSGKTSTSYFMAALLDAAKQKTGLTVSPIIDQVSERVQINLESLSEAEFSLALTEFINLIEQSAVNPSRFELLIAFAYWYFYKAEVDYAVIEVGLGGLKDATNAISSKDKICLITDIGYDHTEVLGNTLEEIAYQKAGIIHTGNQVFTHPQEQEAMTVLEREVGDKEASLNVVTEQHNPYIELPDYQFHNWDLAYAAYKYLVERDNLRELPEEELAKTRHIQVPGRMDVKKHKDKTIILDGAHNTQKMTAFVSSFKKLYPNVKPAILIAMKNGKDYEKVADILSPIASRVITTTFKSYHDTPLQSLPSDLLAEVFSKNETLSISDLKPALGALLSSPEEVLVITGSLYLLGQVRAMADYLK